MRRIVLGLIMAAVIVSGLSVPSPVLAHEPAATPSAADTQRERDARAEAGRLTDELRTVASSPAKAPAIRAAAASKAERRQTLINQLSKSDPASVLDLALTPAERAMLPEPLRRYVEQRVDLDGELRVRHVDQEDGHSAYDIKLVKGGQATTLTLGAPLGSARPGDQVKLNGVALVGDPTVVADQMVVVQSPTEVATTGPQRTAIILVQGGGATAHPYANKASTASIWFSATNPLSARAFYLEASYGQTTIVGANGNDGSASDVYGPVEVTSTGCDVDVIAQQALEKADPVIDFNSYDRIVFSIAAPACGNGGVGSLRTHEVGRADGAIQHLSLAWIFNASMGSTSLDGKIGGTAIHEYGHNLGVWHANSLECGASAIGGSTCASDEYGDPSDVMGISSGYGHPNGVHKEILGWLGARAKVATTTGIFTVNAYENAFTDTKTIKVPRTRDANGNVNGYYYLEYRKPTTHWSAFTTTRPDYGNGVVIHTSGTTPFCTIACAPDFSGPGGGGDSSIIDTQPSSQTGTNDFRDAPMLQGETFTDTAAGVTITVNATGPTSAEIALTFGTPRRAIQTIVYPEGFGSVTGGGTFTPGDSVTLTASPADCFLGWRENRAGRNYPNPYTFAVAADRTLEAVFEENGCVDPPPNDAFPGTTVGVGQQTAVTPGATLQNGETDTFTCEGSTVPLGKSVWYTITPTVTSQFTLSTAGSNYDTMMAVYTGGALTSLTPLACNDDITPLEIPQSQVQFTAQAGTPYRIQVSGFNGEAGNLVLAVASASQDAEPRQEGPIRLTGNLTPGGTATFTVTVKNYGTKPSPALRPYIEGTRSSGGAWRIDTAVPNAAALPPGESVTFTLSQPLTVGGTWTTTGIALWNHDTNTAWRSLPANGNSQQISFQVAIDCAQRPDIVVSTAVTGDGRLAVTMKAPASESGNRIKTLQFTSDSRTPTTNALIDLPGIGNARTAPTAFDVPNAPATYTFYVRRQTPGVPVTLPVTVTDTCGAWQTIIGGGTGAGF